MTFRLLPAHAGCGAADRTHEAPVALTGCIADEQSNYLTFNAPDRPAPFNGAVEGNGYVLIRVICTNAQAPPCAAPGDQEDIGITVALEGVRCQGISGGCAAAAAPYSGKILFDTPIRITDHRWDSGDPDAIFNETGNTDYSATFGSQCSAGTCSSNTSLEAIIPGSTTVEEGGRQSLDIFRFNVYDGGANGNLAATPFPTSGVCPPACIFDGDGEMVFMRNGIFAP